MNWYVLYVNSRAEKKVAQRLQDQGFEVFCPTRWVVREWSDRKKKVELPYFSSYVFVRMAMPQRIEVLNTPGVVNFVYWLGRPALVRDEEMAAVMDFFERYEDQDIQSDRFPLGSAAEIAKGGFQGFQGVVVREGKHRVVLEVKQLGMAFRVELAKSSLKEVGGMNM